MTIKTKVAGGQAVAKRAHWGKQITEWERSRQTQRAFCAQHPDIIEQLMAGRQPRRLTLMWFQRNPLPVEWQAQRDIITHFE